MIVLEGINKIYKVGGELFYALKDLDLGIADGEMVAICGSSGSGKTTLLNIIGCLDNPDSGNYYLDGVEVGCLRSSLKARVRNEKIGFVLQDFALINTQSVLYNVELPLLYSEYPYKAIKAKAINALEMVGIADQAKKKANQLSGGQRQRVAIARALVTDPDMILADEPTGQLDSSTGKQIMEQLKEINSKGKTLIIVTHDMNVASMAPRVLHMKDGRIV